MSRTKQAVFTDRLPATPCTPQMREELWQYAKNNGESLADVQREAVALFLAQNVSKTITDDSHIEQEKAS